MSGGRNLSHVIGLSQINSWFVADTEEKTQTGTLVNVVDPYWGGRELIYCYAGGTIAQFATVVITPTLASGKMRYVATEVPNTANLGRPVGVALVGASSGQYIWVAVSGLVPAKSGASVAADTAIGITAAGTLGAIASGKQLVNARSILAATTTVAKTNCSGLAASYEIEVPNSDGLFIGAYLSGTGVGSGAVITSISPNGRKIAVSVANSALISGTVTATYNNSTVFYNVVHLNRPFAQGQVA